MYKKIFQIIRQINIFLMKITILSLKKIIFYYEDKYGGLKIPKPSMRGKFQIENASTAIASLRFLEDLNIKDEHIKNGVKKAYNSARLEEVKSGKLKNLIKNNTLIVDSSHNAGGSKALNEYLKTLNCNKHVIVAMMENKDHEGFISFFRIFHR